MPIYQGSHVPLASNLNIQATDYANAVDFYSSFNELPDDKF